MAKRRVFRKRRTTRRSFKKRSFGRKRRGFSKRGRIPRKPIRSGTMASTVETVAFQDIGTNTGSPYNFNFNISQFARAQDLSENFRYYRAAKVTWTYENMYNSYTQQAGLQASTPFNVAVASDTIPYLYWKMDRTGQEPFQSISNFQDAGAKPFPLNRKKVISYIPNLRRVNLDPDSTQVVDPGGDTVVYAPIPNGNLNSLSTRKAAWATTTSDTTQTDTGGDSVATWYGHQAIIDQQLHNNNTNPVLARVVCTVHWQFKDPFIDPVPPALRAAKTILTKAEADKVKA